MAGAIVFDWLFGNRHKAAARRPWPYVGTDFCDGDCCDPDAAFDRVDHGCCVCDPELDDDQDDFDLLDEMDEMDAYDDDDRW